MEGDRPGGDKNSSGEFNFPKIIVSLPSAKRTICLLIRDNINNVLKEVSKMLIIDSKDCENIDKALKKYKKKFEKAKVLVQLRERQSFTKPSVKRRGEVLKAVYKQQVAAGKFEL
jgi:small subunit ribosomal protein S21